MRLRFQIPGLLATVIATTGSVQAANIVAKWSLDDTAPYADSGPNNISLLQDGATSTAGQVSGVAGSAARLLFQDPGPSTRLYAQDDALENNSFGFSFFLNPNAINPFDKLIAKERAGVSDPEVPDWERVTWQVQATGDAGGDDAGKTRLEFVVRGSNGLNGSFYGNALSAPVVPLGTDTNQWFHVAGGYDFLTGEITLYVDGVKTTVAGTPFANNSDGSPFSIGTYRNGADFKGFAAGADIDEVALYDAPLTQGEVDAIIASVPEPASLSLLGLALLGLRRRRA